MVTTDEDANDTRIKRLVLTPTAVTHFEKLGESLKSVTGSAMA